MIDLNCDLGERADLALEAALIDGITSASIACGGHVGDDATMQRTARLALARGVRIGAHPGYPDPANFGRERMPLSAEAIETTVYEQIMRLAAIIERLGGVMVHVKPHGALYNVAQQDLEVARAIGRAVLRAKPSAILFGLAGSAMLDVWGEMGITVWGEGFADRRYESDGSLRARNIPGALITHPSTAAQQAVLLAQAGRAQTICVHSDTPGAIEILKACRESLSRAGFSLRRT